MKIDWAEITALFGGTFDPPHIGHREAVQGLFSAPGVKRVIVLPTALPPHKKGNFADAKHRVAMTKLCFAPVIAGLTPLKGTIQIDQRELERAERTGRPSYTFETLTELNSTNLAFVIGADQLRDLPSWYHFPELLTLSNWLAIERRPSGSQLARQALRNWETSGLVRPAEEENDLWQIRDSSRFLKLVSTEAPAISSTEIRKSIALSGEAPIGSLVPEVLAYLKQNHLYGS